MYNILNSDIDTEGEANDTVRFSQLQWTKTPLHPVQNEAQNCQLLLQAILTWQLRLKCKSTQVYFLQVSLRFP